ncbi:hypothetical protein ABGB07_46160, partial [Micromonosporaceae bacterium B7E4]
MSDLTPVTVQRSTNEITWTTVRGGAVTPSAGIVRVDDYEFVPGVVNYYRVLGPTLWDAFGRTVASSWDTADSGQAYTTAGGAASDHSVSGGTGRQSLGTVNVERSALVDVAATDVHVQADVQLPVGAATGAPIRLRLNGRAADAANGYLALVEVDTSAVTRLAIQKRVAGVISTVVSSVVAGSNAAGNWWRVTLDCAGSTLAATLRNLSAGGATTTLTGTDAAITAGTLVGPSSVLVAGNTNTLPV